MKTFKEFVLEDFNSPKATQFLINVNKPISRTKSEKQSVMMFYESVTAKFINISSFVKSFLSKDVSVLMKTDHNNWRSMIFGVSLGFRCFVWDASIQHHLMSQALDKNKNLNKYDSNIKYNFLYNESQLLMPGDSVGSTWCFPFVVWENAIHVNLTAEALQVLQESKDIKALFKLSDQQWNSLIKRQQCNL